MVAGSYPSNSPRFSEGFDERVYFVSFEDTSSCSGARLPENVNKAICSLEGTLKFSPGGSRDLPMIIVFSLRFGLPA
jgi:hypothetical protein